MPKRSSKTQAPKSADVNRNAFLTVLRATGGNVPPAASKKNPAAVALGRLGGKKGGKARAASLTAAQRSEIAKRAADARWAR